MVYFSSWLESNKCIIRIWFWWDLWARITPQLMYSFGFIYDVLIRMSVLFDLLNCRVHRGLWLWRNHAVNSNSTFKKETVECFTSQIILVDSCFRVSQFGSLSIGETIETPKILHRNMNISAIYFSCFWGKQRCLVLWVISDEKPNLHGMASWFWERERIFRLGLVWYDNI